MTTTLQFLSGGGEMGALIRNHDWESSPLGPSDKWPQSLRTTLSILVHSKFPMFLYWGPQLLCFYNDAYRFSLGNNGKHPAILGMKGEEAWPETWHLIKPSIDQIINNGESTWSEDQIIPIFRDGTMKDAYWSFSFSAVKDESNQTAGVFLTLIETTEKVNNLKKLIETNDRLAFAIEATELGTFDLNPVTNKFIANNRLKDWFGLPHELEVDLPLAIQQIAEKDQVRVAAAIQQTLQYESGGLYDIEYSILNPLKKQERFVRAKGRARFGEDKIAQRFTGTIQDVTKQVIDKKIIEANEKRTEVERKTLHNFFYQAPAMLAILKGPQHIFEFANPPYLELIGNRNPIGKTVLEALPEVAEQGFIELLDKVYHTGETFTGREVSIDLDKGSGQHQQFYLNFTYQSFANEKGDAEGILVFAYDVTEQVVARKLMEASEKRFSNILEQSIMAVQIFKGREMRIVFMNEPMIVLYGKGPDVIGKTLLEVLPEMKDQPFPQLLDDVYTTGVPYYGYEMPGTIVRDGKPVQTYFNFVYQPYREVDNSITGITVIATEVGLQVIARKQIEESEKQFRIFADSIQNLAWIANADGFIYWYNQRWYDYTGTALKDMEGSGWEKVHHPDKIKEVHKFLEEAWKKDEHFELTCQLRSHDGEYRWFLTRAYPVKDINGKIERWIGTNTDINEQKTAEQKKDEFISIASHEMKTPLTTAKGYIGLLLLSLSEENSNTLYASKANQAIERLNELVTELLDSSKIQNGQLNFTKTTFDFNTLLEETIENFQLSAENHRLHKKGNSLKQINADRGRLEQVIINLLSNAVKYSPNADKILITIEEKPNMVQVSFEDFGVGMSAKHLDNIFDRYYRVEEHSIHFQGLGIGLYISKNIIERHGGKMWVESEPEKGSIFYFTLPV